MDALTTSKADLNKLLDDMKEDEDEVRRYQFYLDDKEIKTSIKEVLERI